MLRRNILPLLVALATTACGIGPGISGLGTSRFDGFAAKEVLPLPMAYFDREAIFPAAKRLIEGAKNDIQIDMFYMGGQIGEEIAAQLVGKKRAGLDVKFMYDPGLGYKEVIKKTVRPVLKVLKDGGVEALPFPVSKLRGVAPIKADHNKFLIVDGKHALVGGMNFADVNAPNHDVMVEVSGNSARYMRAVFMRSWALAGGQPRQDNKENIVVPDPETSATEDTPAQEEAVSVTHSGLFGFPTRPQVVSLIDNARRRIWLEMFVLADDDICERLIAAAKRGVEVKVITDPNKFAFGISIGGIPNLGAVRKFHGTPVQIQFYDTNPDQQMHIKMCIFDDERVAVGSTNWTKAGFDSNCETTLIIQSKQLATQLARTFRYDWEVSSVANPPSQTSPGFKGTVADWISFLF
ncbi:MAG: phosphatidylserine/phosphatidylglycerophosphate/cardiolipin synthase family protein [Cyanobacteria bacterium NC_groundwater_1444_Ag_S-0.65um_54_12]|nr:phosphatidylserine/phosphatidylglycerophosphate/cardiolipin synthase family protein [Cyanobacteria bacterium NC_groundwater_1444_Ag_S-0.65um_54_12]